MCLTLKYTFFQSKFFTLFWSFNYFVLTMLKQTQKKSVSYIYIEWKGKSILNASCLNPKTKYIITIIFILFKNESKDNSTSCDRLKTYCGKHCAHGIVIFVASMSYRSKKWSLVLYYYTKKNYLYSLFLVPKERERNSLKESPKIYMYGSRGIKNLHPATSASAAFKRLLENCINNETKIIEFLVYNYRTE